MKVAQHLVPKSWQGATSFRICFGCCAAAAVVLLLLLCC
jgi:hypothetical protein